MTTNSTAKSRGKALAIGFSCMLLLLVVLARLFLTPERQIPFPQPNGYDDFVVASEIVRSNLVAHRIDPPITGPADLLQRNRRIVEECRLALDFVQAGLKKESRVPLPDLETYDPDYVNRISDLLGVAGWALARAAEVSKADGNTNETARIWMQAIRFAHESTRGGLLAGHHQMMIYEEGAIFQLQRLVASLDATTCRELLSALKQVDSAAEAPDEIITRDRQWRGLNQNAVQHLRLGRFKGALAAIREKEPAEKWMRMGDEAVYRAKALRQQRRRRQLILELAAHTYLLERGRVPTGASDIIPVYLETVPVDPQSRIERTLEDITHAR